jgi:septin family protein
MLIILVGEACVGKTTLENKLCELDGVDHVTIFTTRNRRDDDCENLVCVGDREFGLLSNDLDCTFLSNEDTLYGYKTNFSPDVDINVVSFLGIDEALNFINSSGIEYKIYKLTADNPDIYDCYKARGYSEDDIARRISISTNNDDIVDVLHRDTAYEHIKGYIDEYKAEA